MTSPRIPRRRPGTRAGSVRTATTTDFPGTSGSPEAGSIAIGAGLRFSSRSQSASPCCARCPGGIHPSIVVSQVEAVGVRRLQAQLTLARLYQAIKSMASRKSSRSESPPRPPHIPPRFRSSPVHSHRPLRAASRESPQRPSAAGLRLRPKGGFLVHDGHEHGNGDIPAPFRASRIVEPVGLLREDEADVVTRPGGAVAQPATTAAQHSMSKIRRRST